jgi:soluble lytic murein transglycosylase
MKLRILFLILFITCCSPLYSEEIDGKACLIIGKNELENGQYEKAIFDLSAAVKEFPLLSDYAMLWLSAAYHEVGNHKDSLKTIRTLLAKYPHSSLVNKSRIREIKESEEISEENIQNLYKSYLEDYPGDTVMRYSYAQWLKKNGKTDIAKSVFKDIYVDAGLLSDNAYSELSPSDITLKDVVKRALNLIQLMDYKGAESALRSVMLKDDGRLKNKILKGLGLSLFRQKKYLEAAEVYKKANERYWEVRSLYRAGEKEAVYSVLDELLKSGDKRVISILVAVASDKRKDGDIDESIKLYQDIAEKYPADCENALWGLGWTYFLKGEYKKAIDVFTKLNDTYNDTKYLYWKARSIEAAGGDAFNIYQTISGKERDPYSIMSYARVKRLPQQSNTIKTNMSLSDTDSNEDKNKKFMNSITAVKKTRIVPKKIDRIEALFDLGLSQEALLELIHVSKEISSVEDLLYICSKFQELGEYKHLIKLVEKVPYMEELQQFRYPLAYRGIIEDLSERYKIDPFLVLSVVREESRFDPEVKSIAGAIGLMQLMPQTAFRLDGKLNLGIKSTRQIVDVKNNLHIGICYLSNLIKEFGSYTYAIAAYNAGEEIVKKWLQKRNYKSVDEFIEDIPYNETRSYVKRVITTFFEYKRFSSTKDDVIEISLEKL